MFDFREFLKRSDLEPRRVKLLRHTEEGARQWARGKDAFGCFASFQRRDRTPFGQGFEVACHFLIGPATAKFPHTALFIGATRILDRWDWDAERLPLLRDEQVIATYRQNEEPHEAFDMEWLEPLDEYRERLLIGWPGGARNWHQGADSFGREILELKISPQEKPFPGFSLFSARISDVPRLPPSWQASLASVRGVYLLLADNGQQYVGSAGGVQGFLGRWSSYARDGHGGNRWLREADHRDYNVSILEVASPDMSPRDLILRELQWMEKLGTRDHGLNHGQNMEERLRDLI